jgi:hypothetical protein
MSLDDGLSIVAIVMSSLALVISVRPWLPGLKQGLVIARDTVLWAAVVVLVILVATIGWTRFADRLRDPDAPARFSRLQDPPPAVAD